MDEPTRIEFVPATAENILAAIAENEAAIDAELAQRAVCDRCNMPAVEIDGVWQHAEVADTVFCALMRGAL
jgi:hypothetical protein